MSKINLAKALKVKNSLISEINRSKAVFARENSRKEGSTSKVDREQLWDQISVKTQQLVKLKGQIAAANIAIYPTLALMEEAKSAITFLQQLNTTDGKVVEHSRYGTGPNLETNFSAFITQDGVDKRVNEFQKIIEDAQDAVDAYNATTFIEVSFV